MFQTDLAIKIFLCFFIFSYHSYFNRAPSGFDVFDDLWKDFALAYEQHTGQEKSAQGPIKIACLPLNHYKPEEISFDVDDEKITLCGQHRSESEDGYETSEFKKIIKLPEGVDPTTVTSRVIQDGGALLFLGSMRVEEKAKEDNGKFAVKVDLSGFRPDEIKVQLRGNELTITGEHSSDEGGYHLSRDYSRRILLPNDSDLSSVRSRLSKEGVLSIEASLDPALVPRERSLEVTMEVDEPSKDEGN